MRLISDITEFEIQQPTAVAIGKFDGIHLGHRLLLQQILEAKEKGLLAVVFTFHPSPAELFSGRITPELTTLEEKREYFAAMGVDVLYEFPMNKQTAATEPDAFVREYIAKRLNARLVVAGSDVSYGKKGLGDLKLLQEMAGECGYKVCVVDKLMISDAEVSSTRIRERLLAGDMEAVTALLGTPYTVSGIVQHGKQLGRTIGMPTANIYPSERKLLPPNGVYYSITEVDDKVYSGITNIGKRPTVEQDARMNVETCLNDFEGDLYGKMIRVKLLGFRRPEMRFSSVDELMNTMHQDKEAGIVYAQEHGIK